MMRTRSGVSVLLLLAGWTAPDCRAQNDPQAVLSATLVGVEVMLRQSPDAVEPGTIALDSHILRAEVDAHADAVALRWVGYGGDSVRTPGELRFLLDRVNRSAAGSRWIACGGSAGSEPCRIPPFFAIVAVSEPWICGDRAQVLASIRYRSTETLHPTSWQASVARLIRVDGGWRVEAWHLLSTN